MNFETILLRLAIFMIIFAFIAVSLYGLEVKLQLFKLKR